MHYNPPFTAGSFDFFPEVPVSPWSLGRLDSVPTTGLMPPGARWHLMLAFATCPWPQISISNQVWNEIFINFYRYVLVSSIVFGAINDFNLNTDACEFLEADIAMSAEMSISKRLMLFVSCPFVILFFVLFPVFAVVVVAAVAVMFAVLVSCFG